MVRLGGKVTCEFCGETISCYNRKTHQKTKKCQGAYEKKLEAKDLPSLYPHSFVRCVPPCNACHCTKEKLEAMTNRVLTQE